MRRLFFAGLLAFVAMFGYALVSRLYENAVHTTAAGYPIRMQCSRCQRETGELSRGHCLQCQLELGLLEKDECANRRTGERRLTRGH